MQVIHLTAAEMVHVKSLVVLSVLTEWKLYMGHDNACHIAGEVIDIPNLSSVYPEWVKPERVETIEMMPMDWMLMEDGPHDSILVNSQRMRQHRSGRIVLDRSKDSKKKPKTNITKAIKRAFNFVTSPHSGGSTCLFSCFLGDEKEPTATICGVWQDPESEEYIIEPLFVAVTPNMKLYDHDGRLCSSTGGARPSERESIVIGDQVLVETPNRNPLIGIVADIIPSGFTPAEELIHKWYGPNAPKSAFGPIEKDRIVVPTSDNSFLILPVVSRSAGNYGNFIITIMEKPCKQQTQTKCGDGCEGCAKQE